MAYDRSQLTYYIDLPSRGVQTYSKATDKFAGNVNITVKLKADVRRKCVFTNTCSRFLPWVSSLVCSHYAKALDGDIVQTSTLLH